MFFSVLLVEGNGEHRAQLSEFLMVKLPQAQLYLARDLAEARDQTIKIQPDVLICAMHLPDGKALDVLACLTYGLGLVIVEAGQEQLASEAMRCGFADFVIRDAHGNYRLTLPAQVEALRERLQLRSNWQQAQTAMHQLAYTDELTHLPNRRAVLQCLKQWLQAPAHGYGCVLLLGIDGFKDINDGMGPEWGDQLLTRLSQWLQQQRQPEDVLARWGGDEFVLLKPLRADDAAQAQQHAQQMAKQLQQSLSQAALLEERSVYLHVSVGIAVWGAERLAAEMLMQRACLALNQAKGLEKQGVCTFSSQLQVAVMQRAALAEDIHRALAREELVLHFQPLVCSKGRVQGVEALVRWQHPSKGLIGPGVFIPVAERSGLIAQIDRWVLRKACEQLQVWSHMPARATWSISVNVSAQEFKQADFVSRIQQILRDTQAPAHRLKIELTESLMLHDVQETVQKMNVLTKLGIGFSLDDFGTGYSALAYLKRLPLNQIKVDRSFIEGVEHNPSDAAIVQCVIQLGQQLGLEVVAEGVETPAQRDCLVSLGCDRFQGFLYSRPTPVEQLLDWM